ncbi:transcription antiterminator BlgG [Paracoccus sp. SSK6]|uniref:transcription antiterminator BlgG n=1 Tax=Paracoccus sp. SSK6 TaxID=3143131 RepID=UPI00321A3CBE
MTQPHHIPLRELYVSDAAASALAAEAEKLPGWTLDAVQAGELTLLMTGGFAPLRGYMSESDWRAVQDGAVQPWPVPLALNVGADFPDNVQPGDDIALRDKEGEVLAVMSVTDRWLADGEVRLGGKVKGLRRPAGETPNSLRALSRDRGCERVLAVQPGHADQIAAAARLARQMEAALLVQPLPGVAVEAPPEAIIAPLPVVPPHGPRALLWQGLVARNHGATHVVLGGDAAAQDLYRRHQDEIGARMVVPDGIL